MTQVDKDAINIFCSGLERDPYLEFMSKSKPFLKHNSLILPHEQAYKIINKLSAFYETHSKENIQLINNRLKQIIIDQGQ